MIKANSLLYAIYICLLVALVCSAMLFMAGLNTQLNQYYVGRQNMYVQNESLVNFAIAHFDDSDAMPDEDDTGISSYFEIKQYGVIPIVIAKSNIGNDTITSTHFVGCKLPENTSLYIPNYGTGISYSGNVKLEGNTYLPTTHIGSVFITDVPNNFYCSGKTLISDGVLPLPATNIISGANGIFGTSIDLETEAKNGKIIRSFSKPAFVADEVKRINNLTIKGNVIVKSSDSITVSATAKLEDIILIAPKIIFENNFQGSVQAFASQSITVGNNVKLNYPTVLYSSSHSITSHSEISIKEGSSIYGLIVMYGNDYQRVDYNILDIETNVKAICDIYCTGNTSLKSNVLGSVYTNRISYRTSASLNNNCIANVEVGPGKRPGFFYSIPLFKMGTYGVIKKLI